MKTVIFVDVVDSSCMILEVIHVAKWKDQWQCHISPKTDGLISAKLSGAEEVLVDLLTKGDGPDVGLFDDLVVRPKYRTIGNERPLCVVVVVKLSTVFYAVFFVREQHYAKGFDAYIKPRLASLLVGDIYDVITDTHQLFARGEFERRSVLLVPQQCFEAMDDLVLETLGRVFARSKNVVIVNTKDLVIVVN